MGAVGGIAASIVGLPMPFLLGSLLSVAPVVIWQSASGWETLRFPRPLRFFFVGVIGMLIGSRFSPELVAKLPTIWISLIAVAVFVVLAHLLGYTVYRRLGGYDRVTALYGSMPGGLIEGVALGEKAGGDLVLLTVHHFARIVIVVFTVPFLFLVVSGDVVGSASGLTLAASASSPFDVALIAVIALVGAWVGIKIKLPAGHLMGPLILAGALHATGAITVVSPGWLVALAQLIVGTALATQFAGASIPVLTRAFGLTLVAVLGMFVIAGATAWLMAEYTVLDFPSAFVSFAPGGVAEMGLIALSLDASPVIVAAHHLVRIVLTVIFVRAVAARLAR
ncbi:MAG: AbrB family transcriptional regulator [Pseudomonadota bacterium]